MKDLDIETVTGRSCQSYVLLRPRNGIAFVVFARLDCINYIVGIVSRL